MTREEESTFIVEGDARFAAAVDEYYRRLNRDGTVDVLQFLAEFDDVRQELQSFLDDSDRVQSLLSLSVKSPQSPVGLRTLRYFGDYELQAEIARGGMGIVYRARQTSLDRLVAVKMILAGQLASVEDKRRFQQEATAAAKLRHPNIVAIYEVGEHEGQQFYSMEYVDGCNLAERIRENLCTAVIAAQHVQTIARTLQFIHSQGLLHRDLKPSNVLMEGASGTIRLTDFGLAKRLDAGTVFTSTGQVVGTPSYMSPEQAGGINELVGPRSDIYSAGAILYELVTGRPPFRGDTPWNTAWQVVHSEVVSPRRLNPAIPRDLETICLKCLQKDINRRYETAVELADDLGRFLREEPIHARPVGGFERFWFWCRRNPTLAAISTLACLFLIGLICSLALYARSEQEHASNLESALATSAERLQDSQSRLAAMERDRGLRMCEQGDIDQGCLWLVHSLEIAPPSERDLVRSIRLNLGAWQKELCTLQGVYPDQRHALAFSPDSRKFCVSGDKRVGIYDADTGKSLHSGLSHDFHPLKSVFSADGRLLLLHSNAALKMWKDGAEADPMPETPNSRHFYAVQMTQDGRVLLAMSTPGGMQVVDAMTGNKHDTLLPSDSHNPQPVFISDDGQLAVTQPKPGTLILSNLETGKRVGSAMIHPTRVENAVFNKDSSRLITAWIEQSKDEKRQFLQYWDTSNATRVGSVINGVSSRGFSRDVAVSDDSSRLMSATSYRFGVFSRSGDRLCEASTHHGPVNMSKDGGFVSFVSTEDEARLFDVDSAMVEGQPMGHLGDTLCDLRLSPDGTRVLVSNESGTRLWKTPNRAMTAVHRGVKQQAAVASWLVFSADGHTLLWRDRMNSTVMAWNTDNGTAHAGPIQNKRGFEAVAVSGDGKRAALGAGQNMGGRKDYCSVTLWDLTSGEQMSQEVPSHRSVTHAVTFTKDGKRLVSVGDSGEVYVYDIEDRQIVAGPLQHPGHPAMEDSRRLNVCLSPDQQVFAVFAMFEDSVSLWKMDSKDRFRTLQTAPGLNAIAFSPDSKSLVTMGDQVQFWDLTAVEIAPKALGGSTKAIHGCFDSDGRRLAVSYDDRSVRIWDIATAELAGRPFQLDEAALRVALIDNGRLLVTASASGARIFDVATVTQVGPQLPSMALAAVSPDGKLVATAGQSLRIWRVPESDGRPGELIRGSLEQISGMSMDSPGVFRSLSDQEWLSRRGSDRQTPESGRSD